jgi:hypothetical protein
MAFFTVRLHIVDRQQRVHYLDAEAQNSSLGCPASVLVHYLDGQS